MSFATQRALDLANIFFNTAEFGTQASYTAAGESAVNIDGIFEDSGIIINQYSGRMPEVVTTFKTDTVSVPNAKPKDVLVINSDTYEVVEVIINNLQLTTILTLNKTV